MKLSNMFRSFYFVVYHLSIFDALIQRGFGFFPKITIGNLCKPFHDVIIFPFSTFSWNHKTLGKKEEKFEYWKKQRSFLGEISIFHNLKDFFWWNVKKQIQKNPIIFLSTIWLSHNRIWTIIEQSASLTQC